MSVDISHLLDPEQVPDTVPKFSHLPDELVVTTAGGIKAYQTDDGEVLLTAPAQAQQLQA